MIVVPALAKSQQTEQPVVLAAVRCVEHAPAIDVADRVDTPGDMVGQTDTDDPAPQHAFPSADQIGNAEAEKDPAKIDVRAIHEHDQRISLQPLAVRTLLHRLAVD